jgi:hypothetical protein
MWPADGHLGFSAVRQCFQNDQPCLHLSHISPFPKTSMPSACYVSVNPPVNFGMNEPIFNKLGICIMAPEPISMAYFINPSYQSVCLCILHIVARQRLGKCIPLFGTTQRIGRHVSESTNARNNWRIVGRVCLWVCVCIHLPLLDNNSVKTFPPHRRAVGGVVFYAVRVLSKESRRLVLPRTSFCKVWYTINHEPRSAKHVLFYYTVIWCHHFALLFSKSILITSTFFVSNKKFIVFKPPMSQQRGKQYHWAAMIDISLEVVRRYIYTGKGREKG